MISFKDYCTEGLWYSQTGTGAIDKHDPANWKKMWQSVIDSIKNQLPREYRRLRYIGPFPPTDAPLFSVKKSDEVRRFHLFFGVHKHAPDNRIRVDVGRRNIGRDKANWKILSISAN